MKLILGKKLLEITFIEYICIGIFELLYYITGCQTRLFIFAILLIEILSIIYIVKKKLIISPIILSSIMILSMSLYQLKLVKSYDDLSITCVLIVYICSLIWRIINSYDIETIKHSQNKKFDLSVNYKKLKTCIYILFPIALTCMLLEWFVAGGIPFFREDSEIFRFSVSINGITHILAIMNKIISILILVYWIGNGKINIRKEFFLFIIFIVSTSLIVFTSMRGELIVILAVGLVMLFLKKQPNLFKIFIMLLPVLILIGVYPIFRQFNMAGNSYVSDQKSISVYSNLWFITPFYQTCAYNIKVFDIVINIFSGFRQFGLGQYSILTQIPFVNMGKALNSDISAYTNHSFYSGLTSTYLGPNYADFGFIGCIIITIILAIWARHLYEKFISKKNYMYSILYVYTFYNVVMMAYANTIIDLSFVCYFALIYFVGKYSNIKSTNYQ